MKLNAPAHYRWTDEDVRHEKRSSFLDGLLVGYFAGVLALFLLVVLT